jgi:hypothetical protein
MNPGRSNGAAAIVETMFDAPDLSALRRRRAQGWNTTTPPATSDVTVAASTYQRTFNVS